MSGSAGGLPPRRGDRGVGWRRWPVVAGLGTMTTGITPHVVVIGGGIAGLRGRLLPRTSPPGSRFSRERRGSAGSCPRPTSPGCPWTRGPRRCSPAAQKASRSLKRRVSPPTSSRPASRRPRSIPGARCARCRVGSSWAFLPTSTNWPPPALSPPRALRVLGPSRRGLPTRRTCQSPSTSARGWASRSSTGSSTRSSAASTPAARRTSPSVPRSPRWPPPPPSTRRSPRPWPRSCRLRAG